MVAVGERRSAIARAQRDLLLAAATAITWGPGELVYPRITTALGGWTALVGVVGALMYALALEPGQLSIVSPVVSVAAGVSVVLAVVLLGALALGSYDLLPARSGDEIGPIWAILAFRISTIVVLGPVSLVLASVAVRSA